MAVVSLEVMVPPTARGAFESLRAYDGQIFRCEQHLTRLRESCRSLQIPVRWSDEALTAALYQGLKRSNRVNAFLRLAIYANGDRVERVVTLHPLPHYPQSWYKQGAKIVTSAVRRTAVHVVDPKIKASQGFLLGTLSHIERGGEAIAERIFINPQGYLTEGTTSNLFLIKRGELLTPPTSCGILAGVTRQLILELARQLHIPSHEMNLTRHDLYCADEAFLSSTSREIMPIKEADGRSIGNGNRPVTKRLQAGFRHLVNENNAF